MIRSRICFKNGFSRQTSSSDHVSIMSDCWDFVSARSGGFGNRAWHLTHQTKLTQTDHQTWWWKAVFQEISAGVVTPCTERQFFAKFRSELWRSAVWETVFHESSVEVVTQWGLRNSFSRNVGRRYDAIGSERQLFTKVRFEFWRNDVWEKTFVEISAGIVTQCIVRGSFSRYFGRSCDAVRFQRQFFIKFR